MEGAHFIKSGKLLKLSEQQLVDCVDECDGCDGGLEAYALKYLERNGQELENVYPAYSAKNQSCSYNAKLG